jgi:hypothetical protein
VHELTNEEERIIKEKYTNNRRKDTQPYHEIFTHFNHFEIG